MGNRSEKKIKIEVKNAIERLKKNNTLARQSGSGRPVTKSTSDNVEKAKQVLTDNPHASASDVMRATGNPENPRPFSA